MDELPVDVVGLGGLLDEELLVGPREVVLGDVRSLALVPVGLEPLHEGVGVFFQHFVLHILVVERNEGDSGELSVVLIVLLFDVMDLALQFFDFPVDFQNLGVLQIVVCVLDGFLLLLD